MTEQRTATLNFEEVQEFELRRGIFVIQHSHRRRGLRSLRCLRVLDWERRRGCMPGQLVGRCAEVHGCAPCENELSSFFFFLMALHSLCF